MVVYFDHCYHRSLYLAYDDNYVVTYRTNFRNFLFVVRVRRLVSKGCSYSVVKLAEMVTIPLHDKIVGDCYAGDENLSIENLC